SSKHSEETIIAMFVAVKGKDGWVYDVAPCGVCRQRILEYEKRYRQNIALYWPVSEKTILKVSSIKHLLPFAFSGDKLESP
ncbi:MAG: hypothetical protein NZ522_00450, partial [Chitinophagales bacterium]|nr:hypothetical protein [Chitinophagales bacterium]